MKNIISKLVNFTAKNPYFLLLAAFMQVGYPLLSDIGKLGFFAYIQSLYKLITSMTFPEVLTALTWALVGYNVFLLMIARKKNKAKMEALEKSLQERTEALEISLYHQARIVELIRTYTAEHLKDKEFKSLADMNDYNAQMVKYLFRYENEKWSDFVNQRISNLDKLKRPKIRHFPSLN